MSAITKQLFTSFGKVVDTFARTVIISVVAALQFGFSQASANDELYHFPKIEKYLIDSEFIDQTYEIHVMLPISKKDGSEKFPVLYMTDANGGIPFSSNTRIMQTAAEIPRFIVVGIGYPVNNIYEALNLRQRDLTPTESERPEYNFPIEGIETIQSGKKTGGGPEFLRFIREQLMPFINERYNTVPNDSSYFGHSLGGLFGLSVLFHAPETFNRYIIGSPAMWWDNEVIFSDAQEFLNANEALNISVYMTVGGMEERDRPEAHWVSNLYRMDALLRSKPIEGFTLKTEVFPEEAHISVYGMLHSKGLREVYGPAKCSLLQPGSCE